MLGGRDMLRSLRVAALSGAAGAIIVFAVPLLLTDLKIARLEGPRPTGIGRVASMLMYPELWGCLAAAAITGLLVWLELRHRQERAVSGSIDAMGKAA